MISNKEISEQIKGKKILVIGGTGSIGSEIVRLLLQYEPEVVRILSNDEACLFELQQELKGNMNVRFLLGDIRDIERMKIAMENIDLVFHAAALKHVPLCEYNPMEAINTNVIGTDNVIKAAIYNKVDKCIFISTDKAVNPTSVMGATKMLAERLVILANSHLSSITKFSVVRFGNVLDSRGSIIPLIRKQIISDGRVTITDPNMTRFIMSIPQAVNLVFKAAALSNGGEIFVFKMPAVRIMDLIEVLIEELAPEYGIAPESIERVFIGPRAREKIHEELMIEDEIKWMKEKKDMFIITYPIELHGIVIAGNNGMNMIAPVKGYSSESTVLLSKEEIKNLLSKEGVNHSH
ncbi:MAG: polysaccharide biosynthesis protein [Candidatus Methanoperedens sp.]|nr:polysaccharide biosynthesis protein [Candidatus Methanoperedens sp.]